MQEALDRIVKDLEKKILERRMRTQEFMARDYYFIGLMQRMITAGMRDGDIDKDVADRVQKLMNEHHKMFQNQVSSLMAGLDQLIAEMEEND